METTAFWQSFYIFCFINYLIFHVVVLFCWHIAPLYRHGCLGNYSVDQNGLEVRDPFACFPDTGFKVMCHLFLAVFSWFFPLYYFNHSYFVYSTDKRNSIHFIYTRKYCTVFLILSTHECVLWYSQFCCLNWISYWGREYMTCVHRYKEVYKWKTF